ncbi:hypothetical protein JTB14_030962 [Gonioctena quinquepunctata]|nr:hypothetical protein JTB14_030962 [Gonioctena quinquepunctata]
MAPKYMDTRNFTSSDISFIKHIANNPEKQDSCTCQKLQYISSEKKDSKSRLAYGRSLSLFDLSNKKKDGDQFVDKSKRCTLGSAVVGEFGKEDQHKSKQSKLVLCWRKFKRSLTIHTNEKSKDGSKVTTVIATPGQGPDRPQEVSYTDTKVIGNGSFGVVYQAKLCETSELVAIKKVLQDKRFKNRELQIMRKLEHCNIVKLKYFFYSSGDKKDEVYLNLVLEYIPETVYKVARHYSKSKQTIPISFIKLYMYQLFRSLAYIHSLGICHRDIKPQNLLLDPETGVLKLCDFGSAKHLVKGDSGVDQLVEIIKVLGTPTKEQIKEMNPNYTEFKFPQIKSHPWQQVFRARTPPEAIELVARLLEYTPSSRISPLQACAHPFFSELREPNTRLPNGNELPPLFNFTEQELNIQPSLNSVLLPRGTQDASNNPQDGATSSGAAETSDSTSSPLQAAASGIA